MGLQRFKMDVASAVVNQDNMSLSNMDTSQLLDLFAPPAAGGGGAGAGGGAGLVAGMSATGEVVAGGGAQKKGALQTVLDGMGELWDEQQYEQQFDVAQFARKLRKQ
jgi:TATA-binding protein-associated factor